MSSGGSGSAVAGVRLAPASLVLWVSAEGVDLIPGTICLLRTPDGDRSARVVVAPQHLVSDVAPLPGYRILSTLTDEEALGTRPAATLNTRLCAVAGRRRYRIDADGSRATLLGSPGEDSAALAADRTRDLLIPVVVRDESGRLPRRDLPQLLQRVTYQGVTATVTGVSVFRGEIVLTAETGEALTVALEEAASFISEA